MPLSPLILLEPMGQGQLLQKPRAATTLNNAHHLPNKAVLSVSSSDEDHFKYPHPLSRGAPVQIHDMSDERLQDSRDGDEFLGESSPGFDVIVDHDQKDYGYLSPNEEDFRRAYADSYNHAEMYPTEDHELMSRYERTGMVLCQSMSTSLILIMRLIILDTR
jgi:hypothetical protein